MSDIQELEAKVEERLSGRKVVPTVKVTGAARATTKPIKSGDACRVCTVIKGEPAKHDPDRMHRDTNETEAAILRKVAKLVTA